MGTFQFAATGDSIFLRPFPETYTGWKEVADFLRQADVRMNNMENVLADYDCCASAYCGTPWLCAPPARLDDLQKCFGFDLYSFANNHTLDYFYTGMQSTLNAFRARGLGVSGAGEDLEIATRHCSKKTEKGSCALIAVTTTSDDSARAGYAHDCIPGRPGVSKLRHIAQYTIRPEKMAHLKEIAEVTCIDGRANNSRKGGYLPQKPGVFYFGGHEFLEGENEGKTSVPHPKDLARICEAVRRAKAECDYAVVYFHSHEIRGMDDEETDFFLDAFCHAVIDAGADACIGSGTHQVKAVEFYKGKPIFYSIANFIFRVSDMEHLPMDYHDRFGVDPDLPAEEAVAVQTKNGTAGLEIESYCYRALAARITWEDGKAVEVVAKPLGLGFHASREEKGLPRSANAEETELLLRQLQKLSAPYGTEVTLRADGLLSFRPTKA